MAFENHWADSDVPTHRLLSAPAWRTDERDRPQVDIDGLEAALRETRLELPRSDVVAIWERLGEEEILESSGPTYRYAVPLYRRRVLWKHGPERVRVESTEKRRNPFRVGLGNHRLFPG